MPPDKPHGPTKAVSMSLTPTEGREQFKKVAWPFLENLLRTARFLTRDAADAEDLVQDSVLKAWRSFESFRVGTDIRAWLLTILRRTHIDHVRHNGRHAECSLEGDAPSPTTSPTPAELDERWTNSRSMMEQFDDEEITEALRALPDDIRWTILLVHVEQLHHEQAAAIMGVPVGTVKSRAYRGRQMLKKWLTEGALSQRTPVAERVQSYGPRQTYPPAAERPAANPCPLVCAS